MLEAPVEAEQAVVDVGAAPAARPDPAHHRVLGPEGARAPEPVGVPAPQVVLDGEQVALAVLQRAVEDLLTGVVAGVGRADRALVGPPGQGQVQLAGLERGAVETVDALSLPAAGVGDLLHGAGQRVGVVEADVAQRDVGRHLLEVDDEPRGVAQRAVGVRERVEQVVAGVDGDDLAVAGEDVHLAHRLVRQAVAEAGRLDAQAGDGAAEGDGAQLGHHQRDQAVGQRGRDEVLVGAHALDLGGARVRVDLEHAGQARDVEAGGGGGAAVPEQVRGLLGQAHRPARRDPGVGLPQPLHRLPVPAPDVLGIVARHGRTTYSSRGRAPAQPSRRVSCR